MRGDRAAGQLEIWAARAWNLFNEGRPFSLVYPALVLVCAAPLGLGPDGSLAIALAGALGLALVESRFEFPLRARALLWLAFALEHSGFFTKPEDVAAVADEVEHGHDLEERLGRVFA